MMALHSTLSPPGHEPMVMGSPPSPQAGYLPGYLMGGDTVGSPGLLQPSRSAGALLTGPGMPSAGLGPGSPLAPLPNRSLHASFTQQPAHPAAPTQQQQQRFLGNASPLNASQRKRTPNVLGLDARGRQGPPTSSLWSTPPVTPAQARLGGGGPLQEVANTPRGHSTPRTNETRNATAVMNLFKDSSMSVPQSPAQVDPFYTQGDSLRHEDVLDERWITVFGYPSNAAAYTIEQFSHCGTIVKHVITNEGNWAHLKFQTKLQAKRALSKNGKIFAENFMIGVQPCIDKRVMAEDGADSGESLLDKSATWEPIPRAVNTPRTPLQPQGHASVLGEQSMNASFRGNASMRSLTANRPGGSGEAVARKEAAVSVEENQSKESILSKAFGFVFGWT